MKKLALKSLLAFVLLIGSTVNLKSQQQNDEIQMVQSMWGLEKRSIVADYMKLTPTEASVFWPVYDKYQEEYKALGKERIMIISDYASNLPTLTNEKADELIKRMSKNNKKLDCLQYKYYKKMKKEITALRAAQFIQLDSYIQTMIRAEMQSNIPMIGDLDKKAK